MVGIHYKINQVGFRPKKLIQQSSYILINEYVKYVIKCILNILFIFKKNLNHFFLIL